jgi:hypothetical protein
MDKENHILALEKILKEIYPLLPLESNKAGVVTIKYLSIEFNKEVERRLKNPELPGIKKNWDNILIDTVDFLKLDSKGYLQTVYNNIHPSHRALREDLKRAIDE